MGLTLLENDQFGGNWVIFKHVYCGTPYCTMHLWCIVSWSWVQYIFGVASLVLCNVSYIAQACYRSGASTLFYRIETPEVHPGVTLPVYCAKFLHSGEMLCKSRAVQYCYALRQKILNSHYTTQPQ